jgi:ankyrin repeat protein
MENELYEAMMVRDAGRMVAAIEAGANVNHVYLEPPLHDQGYTLTHMMALTNRENELRVFLDHAPVAPVAHIGPDAPVAPVAHIGPDAPVAPVARIGPDVPDVLDLEVRDQQGRTPLHIAILLGHASIADMLLHAGARLPAVVLPGTPPHIYARIKRYDDLVQVLEARVPHLQL